MYIEKKLITFNPRIVNSDLISYYFFYSISQHILVDLLIDKIQDESTEREQEKKHYKIDENEEFFLIATVFLTLFYFEVIIQKDAILRRFFKFRTHRLHEVISCQILSVQLIVDVYR